MTDNRHDNKSCPYHVGGGVIYDPRTSQHYYSLGAMILAAPSAGLLPTAIEMLVRDMLHAVQAARVEERRAAKAE